MALSFEEAFNATNPEDSEEVRNESARRILAGAAANDAYWNSRSDLEALRAQADGHGIVARGGEEEGKPAAIEGTATEEHPAIGAEATPVIGTVPPPTPDNSVDAVAKLRAQVESLGQTPEA